MSFLIATEQTGGKDNVRLGDGPHFITTVSDLHQEKVKSATRFFLLETDFGLFHGPEAAHVQVILTAIQLVPITKRRDPFQPCRTRVSAGTVHVAVWSLKTMEKESPLNAP